MSQFDDGSIKYDKPCKLKIIVAHSKSVDRKKKTVALKRLAIKTGASKSATCNRSRKNAFPDPLARKTR